jgi:hypothetical protein
MVESYPITGMQHKRFDDGVIIEVNYTRHHSNITQINLVRFEYKYSILEMNYNLRYDSFCRIDVANWGVDIGDYHIEAVPRIRHMMRELESELMESELGFTIPRPNKIIDMRNPPAPPDRYTTNPDGTIEVIRSDGQELPPIPINQLANDGNTPAYLTIQTDNNHNTSANIRIYDENDNLILDTETAAQLSVLNKSTEEPAPKRQRTRWELLELD